MGIVVNQRTRTPVEREQRGQHPPIPPTDAEVIARRDHESRARPGHKMAAWEGLPEAMRQELISRAGATGAQRFCKPKVASSSLASGTKLRAAPAGRDRL